MVLIAFHSSKISKNDQEAANLVTYVSAYHIQQCSGFQLSSFQAPVTYKITPESKKLSTREIIKQLLRWNTMKLVIKVSKSSE